MNINRLNYLLLVVSITLAVTFGEREVREEALNLCKERCIGNPHEIAKPGVKYSKLKIQARCTEFCYGLSDDQLADYLSGGRSAEKEPEPIYVPLKPIPVALEKKPVKKEPEPLKIYHDPSTGLPTDLYDCEIKCLAEGYEQHLGSKTQKNSRINDCRKRCAQAD